MVEQTSSPKITFNSLGSNCFEDCSGESHFFLHGPRWRLAHLFVDDLEGRRSLAFQALARSPAPPFGSEETAPQRSPRPLVAEEQARS